MKDARLYKLTEEIVDFGIWTAVNKKFKPGELIKMYQETYLTVDLSELKPEHFNHRIK